MGQLKQNWQDIFRNFRVSLDVWKIVLALLGLVLSVGGGLLIWHVGDLVRYTEMVTRVGTGGAPVMEYEVGAIPLGRLIILCLAAAVIFYFTLRSCVKSEAGLNAKKIGLLLLCLVGLALLVWLFYVMLTSKVVTWCAIAVYLLLVWSIFGGAITRIAGVEIASDNRIGMVESLKFASGRSNAYFWSVFTPLCAVAFIAVFTTVGGWVAGGGYNRFLDPTLLMLAIFFATAGFFMLINSLVRATKNRGLAFLVSLLLSAALWLSLYFFTSFGEVIIGWRYLEWVVALLTVLFLLAGFLMVLVLIGVLFGWPMMFPAVSVEGSDSFDAISRTYSYLYGKPWRYIWYQLAGAAYGTACLFFVSSFALAMVGVVGRTVQFGMKGAMVADVQEYALLGDRVKALLAPGYNSLVAFFAKGTALLAALPVPGFVRGLYKFMFVPDKLVSGGVVLSARQEVAAWVVAIFLYALLAVVVSYLISLLLSIQTTIYMLMRKAVDGVAVTEVYEEEKPEEEKLEEAPPEEVPAEEKLAAEPAKPAPRKKTTRRKVTRRRKTTTRPRKTSSSGES